MPPDPQVAALQKFPVRQSLLDVLADQYDTTNRNAANPFMVRICFAGKKHPEGLISVLETTATESSLKADSTNPFVDPEESHDGLSSIVVDYGEEFIQLLEGPERHIFFYATELCNKKNVFENVVVLFFDDDIEVQLKGWTTIDKPPATALAEGEQKLLTDEIPSNVIQDLNKLSQLGVAAAAEFLRGRGDLFIESARTDHPKLFPRLETVKSFLKSEVFFSLAEFEENFCRFPHLTRDVEINHPAEEPLKY